MGGKAKVGRSSLIHMNVFPKYMNSEDRLFERQILLS